jgi:hypothetical protein
MSSRHSPKAPSGGRYSTLPSSEQSRARFAVRRSTSPATAIVISDVLGTRCLSSGLGSSKCWLCVCADWPVHRRGIRIGGARVEGQLDLAGGEVMTPLALTSCLFDHSVSLTATRLPELDLRGSHLPSLTAERMKVAGSVYSAMSSPPQVPSNCRRR